MSDERGWAKQAERGSAAVIRLTAWVYQRFGRTFCLGFLLPVVTYFYLTGGAQRRASVDWLRRSHEKGWLVEKPSFFSGIKHYLAFAGSSLDKLAGWTGRIKVAQVDGADGDFFSKAKANPRGGLVLTAHMGNPDLLRALATVNQRFRVTVLMHTGNAQRYNGVLSRVAKDSTVRLVQVSEIDIATSMMLAEAVGRGEWVVMAADRSPPRAQAPSVDVPFMGEAAPFPIGPYILASALKCPVYFLACLRTGKDNFRLIFEQLADEVVLPRKARTEAITELATKFAAATERAIAHAPYQWFNFYNFWAGAGTAPSKGLKQ